MMELIKRQMKVEKITLPETYVDVQVGYNDWGHLTVRFFNANDQNHDAVVVFDSETTKKIIKFVKLFIS